MHMLSQEEYGLRCLLQVSRRAATPADRPLTIPEIAEAEGLSAEYAAKLMRALRQGGLLNSTRGAGGGYRLARPPEEITTWQVVEALGGSFFPEGFCDSHPGQLRDCVHSADCSVRVLWDRVEGAVRGVLDSVTLADLTRNESAMSTWIDASRLAADLGGASR